MAYKIAIAWCVIIITVNLIFTCLIFTELMVGGKKNTTYPLYENNFTKAGFIKMQDETDLQKHDVIFVPC